MSHFLINRSFSALVLTLAFGVAVSGCSSSNLEDGTLSVADDTETNQLSETTTNNAQSESPADDDTAVEQSDPNEDALSYEPPFPERLDLFVPPKRKRQIARNKNQEGNVELIGFARVEGREVVLSIIDGSVYSLAEGDIHSGVEVISIKQPAVVLQRGREKWQVSLHN